MGCRIKRISFVSSWGSICVHAFVLVSSIGSSMIGSAVADILDNKIGEFTKWNIL